MEKIVVKNQISNILYDDLKKVCQSNKYVKMSKKHFLLTGGTGFIAYHFVLMLLIMNDILALDNRITLLVRNHEKAANKYKQLLKRNDIEILEQDVCQKIIYDGNFDYIIHAASSADSQSFEAHPIDVFNANVLGIENIFQLVSDHMPESLLYISSFTVYGDSANNLEILDENCYGAEAWNTNRACYSLGKRAAEFLCQAASRQWQYPIKIIRPGFVYGLSDLSDTRVYAEIIRNVAYHEPITLRSSGFTYRSMIYVTDLARAMLDVLLTGKNGEAYNVANEYISIREFAEQAVKVANHSDVFLRFDNPADAAQECPSKTYGKMSTAKIFNQCKWVPQVNLFRGICMASNLCLNM